MTLLFRVSALYGFFFKDFKESTKYPMFYNTFQNFAFIFRANIISSSAQLDIRRGKKTGNPNMNPFFLDVLRSSNPFNKFKDFKES